MNFKKILLTMTAVLATVGVVSCSSCASKPPPEPTPVPVEVVDAAPPAPTTVKVTGPNWELTLPGPGWDSNQSCAPDGTCTTVLVNEARKNVVLFVGKPYNGTSDQYVLTAIRAIKDAGANVASTKQIQLNGHNFVLIEANRSDNVKVWLWFTILSNHGYELSCGGVDDGHQLELCSGVASTLKIN